jgi:glycopeptide antibiotics resistance protein
MFHQLIKPLVFSFILILLSWLFGRLLLNKAGYQKKYPVSHEILLVTFLIYIAWVLCITLLPITVITTKLPIYKQVNLVPIVQTIRQYNSSFHGTITYLKPLFLLNLVGNIVLFIPFGLLLPLISKYKTFKKIFVFALLFSISIELLQFIVYYFGSFRSVDIDDVLLNAMGATIGFFVYTVGRRMNESNT